MPKIEVGYCDYHDRYFFDKYNGLVYCDGKYVTKIEGNTFYIYQETIDTNDDYTWIEKKLLKRSKHRYSPICIIPMIKAHEETIRDVLRAWNFNCKYEWLDKELLL